MAKNPETVKAFMADLTQKLRPLWDAEKSQMLELKKKEVGSYLLTRNRILIGIYLLQPV